VDDEEIMASACRERTPPNLEVGRTKHHANHAHVITGDPLPVRLPRSKGKGGAR
jgi:hypothetical protein